MWTGRYGVAGITTSRCAPHVFSGVKAGQLRINTHGGVYYSSESEEGWDKKWEEGMWG